MAVDGFATTIADTLFGPDQHAGRLLVRTAVRLLARGEPVTLAELATATGIDLADVPTGWPRR